jgi:S-adenosylmethionine decarboxylase
MGMTAHRFVFPSAMSFAFRYFHPNPGWTAEPSDHTDPAGLDSHSHAIRNAAQNTAPTSVQPSEQNPADKRGENAAVQNVTNPVGGHAQHSAAGPITDTVGKHCILELYGCDPARLDDEPFVRSAITNAALRAGATLLHLISHRFTPHGVTGLALLAESHISIHTWPESGYAAVDVFTCGDHTMPESACRVLVEEFGARHQQLRSFRRETPAMLAAAERSPNVAETALNSGPLRS